MYDGPAGVAVRTSLASVAEGVDGPNASDTALLRQRVLTAVDELKAMGWPIERMIVRLKEVAAEVGLRSSRNSSFSGAPLGERDAVVGEAVRWCIERYYGTELPTRRS
jgi:hypothetical protein